MYKIAHCLIISVALSACNDRATRTVNPTEVEEPPRWRFERLEHGLGDLTLTSLWARSDGAVFVAGFTGTIITNRVTLDNPEGLWLPMPTGTTENLTGIVGVENGAEFGLPDADGEMLAVGWHGTVLHYHPNPDGLADTDDGLWEIVSAPGQGRFQGKMRIDPVCPDYDGDGIPDDGDGDGFAGNLMCSAGETAACDDNCREVANGSLRPLSVDDTGCVSMTSTPPPSASWQRDDDADSIGGLCDSDDTTAMPLAGFDAQLMAITATSRDGVLNVVAVGIDGTMLTFQGPGAASTSTPQDRLITNPAAWLAQEPIVFRYDNDCPEGTPAGATCENGRLPPACPAQCSPRRTDCDCPVDQGQCCDATASTGAGCIDGSCGPAVNACDSASGLCSTFCPGCHRRLQQTLRGVTLRGDTIVAVGAAGFALEGSLADPSAVWNAPTCTAMPKPFDESPVLNAIHGSDGGTLVVGSSGALAFYTGGSCPFSVVASNTMGVINGAHATGEGGYVVGDSGLLLQVQGDAVTELDPDIEENLFAITTTYVDGLEWLWMVGAGGVLVTGAYY